MSDNATSPTRGFFVALFASFCVEAIRYRLYPGNYSSSLEQLIVFSLVLNVIFHFWGGDDDPWLKTTISAAYNQFTLPHFILLAWATIAFVFEKGGAKPPVLP